MADKNLQFGTIARNASMARYPHLWQGLVGAWYPSLGVQGSQVIDISGQGNTGAFANSPVWDVQSLLFSKANPDYISIGKDIGIAGDCFTVSARVKYITSDTYKAIIGGTDISYPEFRVATNHTLQLLSQGQVLIGSSDTTLSQDAWFNVGVTYDGTNYKFYVDGVYGGGGSNSQAFTSRNTVLALGHAGGEGFDGYISYISAWNRVLAPFEIQSFHRTNGNALLERRPSALYVPPVNGVVASPYYDMFLKGVA